MRLTLKSFNGVIINSEKDFSYLSNKKYTKKILYIPWFLKRNKSYESNVVHKNIVRFGVVGGIEESRRDYLGVLNSFKELWDMNNIHFHLEFLGRPIGEYGKGVISICKKYNLFCVFFS